MKKLITTILLIISIQVFGQIDYNYDRHHLSFSVDPKLTIDGAYSYDDTPVLDFEVEIKTGVGMNEYGIFLEYAKLNPYFYAFGFKYNRIVKILNNTTVETLTGPEIFVIQRGFHPSKQREWVSGGLNNEIRFNLFSDRASVSLVSNTKWRRDISKVKHSGFVKIGLKF